MTVEWLTLTLGAWAVLLIGAVTGLWWLFVASLLLQFVAAAFYVRRSSS